MRVNNLGLSTVEIRHDDRWGKMLYSVWVGGRLIGAFRRADAAITNTTLWCGGRGRRKQ